MKKVPKAAYKLANILAGYMTMILEKNDLVPYGTTGGLDTVAIRMPSDLLHWRLIRRERRLCAAQVPAIWQTQPDHGTAHVCRDLQGKIQ